MPDAEIILKENIPGLGAEADIVKVRKGYARNHLIPTGKAYEVTPSNLKRLNQLKTKRAEREARELNEAEELARKINKLKLEFTLHTGETGKAFGSVTAKDIEDKLQAEFGITLDRHKIDLERSIKETGEKEITIKLHHDVAATLKIEINSFTPAQSVHEESEATGAKSKGRRKTKPAS
jgi:large subunit ribosomal protein L9